MGSKSKKPSGSKWPSFNLFSTAVIVSIGASFCFGYECLIINSSMETFKQFINGSGEYIDDTKLQSIWGFTVAMFFFGCTLGSVLISAILGILGRKHGLLFTFTVQTIGLCLAISSYFIESLIIFNSSRLLLGFAQAASLGIAQMFVTECSPSSCRGVTSLTTGTLFQFGTVVGAIVAMPTILGSELWWVMYTVELVITIAVTALTFKIKESPSYLLSQAQPGEAEQSIQYYYNLNEANAKIEREKLEKSISKKPYGLFAVWKDPATRYGTLIGTAILVCMLMSGMAAINAFAFDICNDVLGDASKASIANVFICLATVVGILCSNVLIGRFGRRPLLLVGFATLVVLNFCLTVSLFVAGSLKEKNAAIGWIVVTFIFIYNFFISAAVMPIAFFITGELVSQKGRAGACIWSNSMFNLLRSLLIVSYFPLKTGIGIGFSYFLFFTPPCLFAVMIVYFYLPETKGKSPEQARKQTQHLPGFANVSRNSKKSQKSRSQSRANTTGTGQKSHATTDQEESMGPNSSELIPKKKTISGELGRSRDNVAKSKEASKEQTPSQEPLPGMSGMKAAPTSQEKTDAQDKTDASCRTTDASPAVTDASPGPTDAGSPGPTDASPGPTAKDSASKSKESAEKLKQSAEKAKREGKKMSDEAK